MDQSKIFYHFLEHLKHREGFRECVYLDTLGKPTCGVGHLLSPEENAKYAVGDVVDTVILDKWLEEDAEKAWNAAAQQVQDLDIENPAFIVALGSVNFQLGTRWMDKFPSAYEALRRKRYKEAIKQISTGSGKDGKSKWLEQTPVRVEDFIKAIETLTN